MHVLFCRLRCVHATHVIFWSLWCLCVIVCFFQLLGKENTFDNEGHFEVAFNSTIYMTKATVNSRKTLMNWWRKSLNWNLFSTNRKKQWLQDARQVSLHSIYCFLYPFCSYVLILVSFVSNSLYVLLLVAFCLFLSQFAMFLLHNILSDF